MLFMIALYLNIHGILRNITLSSNFFAEKEEKTLLYLKNGFFATETHQKRQQEEHPKIDGSGEGKEKEKSRQNTLKNFP
jgi:hypothetical protein